MEHGKPTSQPDWFQEGVTTGWVVNHSGPGPGKAMKVVALVDAEGYVFIEPAGPWEDVTITPS